MTIAHLLREARLRAGGPSLEEMSRRSGVSVGSLSAAQNADTRMTWRTIRGWAVACGEPIAIWQQTWTWLQQTVHADAFAHDRVAVGTVEARARAHWATGGRLTAITDIETVSELLDALVALRRYQGLSLRDMAREANYSHNTLGEVLAGRRALTVAHFLEILRGCGISAEDQQSWLALFHRVEPDQPHRQLRRVQLGGRAAPPVQLQSNRAVTTRSAIGRTTAGRR
ncbi:helix-turn-helix domain-containing protein [Kitasatospora misakiensis]|uniref:Helix-turn-helix domain-containing protein n=1 Tax=Kitasatospora misakiensis TaxID=67330 RepID=A0ABW0XF44_9ACTN